jgi:hypothetical protein
LGKRLYILSCFLLLSFFYIPGLALAQQPKKDSVTILSATSEKYGTYDTLMVPAIMIEGELVGGRYLTDVFVWGGDPKDLAKYMEKWDRLRRAVYVTYPYARSAGVVMSDILKHLDGVNSRPERRKYIRSREQELRKAFGNQIMDLSIYQGKVLMKLIHRQTGDNCYEIIKEMKGGLTARLYQTIMFFVGSSLKQNWNPREDNTDRLIESFVQEIDQVYAPSASYRYNSAVRQ